MRLPDSLKLEFRRTMKELSEANKMPILMDLEIESMAIGEARGEANGSWKGRQAALFAVLRARFGCVPSEIESAIVPITDVGRLDSIVSHAALAETLEEFQRRIETSA